MRADLFLPEADEEFREAARYYERETPGLGIAFITEVHSAVASVLANPYTAYFAHREHLDRSIMNNRIGHRERSEATLAVD